jgi:hypothetical protein
MYTIPLGLAFGNHRSLETFEVVKMPKEYNVLIPAWYLGQHKVQGTTYEHLHFTEYGNKYYRHGKKYPDWTITYNDKVIWKNDAINIGSVTFNTTQQLAEKLPLQYH